MPSAIGCFHLLYRSKVYFLKIPEYKLYKHTSILKLFNTTCRSIKQSNQTLHKICSQRMSKECPWLSSLFSENIHCFFILTIKTKLRTLTNKCFKNIHECQVISCNIFTLCFKIKNVSHNLQSAFEARIIILLFELSLLVVSCRTLQGWRLLTQF